MQESEEQLIKGCLAGIPAFQQMLYKRYASKMLTVCLRYASNREEAEDVLQEGFMIVFDKMAQFRLEGSFEGWIRRIMVNKSLEHIKRTARVFPILDIDNVDDKFISQDDVLNTIAFNELIAMIQELPPMYKMVFNLSVFDGMTHKEIAETLGVAEGTSKSNLSDARTILKKKILKTMIIENKSIRYEQKAE